MQSKGKILLKTAILQNNTVEPFGIEIICIDNTGYEGFLTIGRNYKAIGRLRKVEKIYYFGLHNDRLGTKDSYPIDLFLTKEEFRDKQLNKILQ